MEFPFGPIRSNPPVGVDYLLTTVARPEHFPHDSVQFSSLDSASLAAEGFGDKGGRGVDLLCETIRDEAVTVPACTRDRTHQGRAEPRAMHIKFEGVRRRMCPLYRYNYYSFLVIPAMGELVAGDRESYQYLAESIRWFPAQEKFASMIAAAGFQKVEYENLVRGVVAIHSGLKL